MKLVKKNYQIFMLIFLELMINILENLINILIVLDFLNQMKMLDYGSLMKLLNLMFLIFQKLNVIVLVKVVLLVNLVLFLVNNQILKMMVLFLHLFMMTNKIHLNWLFLMQSHFLTHQLLVLILELVFLMDFMVNFGQKNN